MLDLLTFPECFDEKTNKAVLPYGERTAQTVGILFSVPVWCSTFRQLQKTFACLYYTKSSINCQSHNHTNFCIFFCEISQKCKKGDLIIIDCYKPHEYKSTEGCETYWVHYDGVMARDLFNLITTDINKVIRYWENQITVNGKRESPLDLKLYISRWQKGVTPSWNIIKLFFDNDLSLPIEYFIDDPDIQKDGYRAFKSNLYMAFLITNLFDSLERNKIISTESRMMIRNGMKLYLKDFFVIRNENGSVDFEKEAKQNLLV